MAISNRWISDVFLCLLLPLIVSAADGTTDTPICNDDSATRTSQYMTYYGCYNLSCFVEETNSTVNDIDQCTNQCKNGSYSYAALFNGDWCSCGKLICGRADIVCDFKCGVPCNVTLEGVMQTCGAKDYFQVYRDAGWKGWNCSVNNGSCGTELADDGDGGWELDSKNDLIATLIKAIGIVIVVIIIGGIVMICCTCILLAVRNLAGAASPGPSSQVVNQPADGDYAEIGPGDSRNEATLDLSGSYPILDLNIKPGSGLDEYHEYADANNLPGSASALRVGKDGYLIPESFSQTTD